MLPYNTHLCLVALWAYIVHLSGEIMHGWLWAMFYLECQVINWTFGKMNETHIILWFECCSLYMTDLVEVKKKKNTSWFWLSFPASASNRGFCHNLGLQEEERSIYVCARNKRNLVIIFRRKTFRDLRAHLNKIAEENVSWNILNCKK